MNSNQNESPFQLGPIAEEIAVIENDKESISALNSQERKKSLCGTSTGSLGQN